ncbi:ATP-binding protein [Vibrio owensii]|uniref:ATP-binding protein n=1 Tax=Vibrio owensii TaxID=696485 RepID=UPI0022DD2DC9|nr:ATP-binding protein [Vibrio owensii]MDA0385982.1 ATP-binding protein [Vibrio owensii]
MLYKNQSIAGSLVLWPNYATKPFEPTRIRTISIDALRYSQILNNLLSNAIKFTYSGRVSFNIELDHKSIRFSITDTGCGMTKEQLSNVFNPFVQADSSIARRYGGSGLGLSIVSELVNLMEGQLNVESIEGVGTRFDVTLPFESIRFYESELDKFHFETYGVNELVKKWFQTWGARQNYNECDSQKVVITSPDNEYRCVDMEYDKMIVINEKSDNFIEMNEGKIELSASPFYPDLLFDCLYRIKNIENYKFSMTKAFKGKVLVAEDNPINQLVQRKQLIQIGLTPHVVDDGKAAFLSLQENPEEFDVLLTDYHMPFMDGFELAKKIREELNLGKHLPIIGCSAENSFSVKTKAIESGFDHMLFKPYGIENLAGLMSDCIPYESDETLPTELKESTNSKTYWLDQFELDEIDQFKDTLIKSLSSDLEILKSNQEDICSIKKVIHRIKGGTSSLGVYDVSEVAIKVENDISNRREFKEGLLELINISEFHMEKTKNYIRT